MKKYIVEIFGELVSISIVGLAGMSFEAIIAMLFAELESCFE